MHFEQMTMLDTEEIVTNAMRTLAIMNKLRRLGVSKQELTLIIKASAESQLPPIEYLESELRKKLK